MENLASKLRPNTLDKIVGQTHIVGENKILNNLVKNKKYLIRYSMVKVELVKLLLLLH